MLNLEIVIAFMEDYAVRKRMTEEKKWISDDAEIQCNYFYFMLCYLEKWNFCVEFYSRHKSFN